MPGFGTVVTGTLVDGRFAVGDEVEISPGEQSGRIRGLQTHKRKEDVASPGSRTAINISGVTVDEIQRGQVVAHPGALHETRRVDVQFRLLLDVSQPLEHNTEVKLFVGAAEMIARLRLIGADMLQTGETGWLQLELRDPIVAVRGDRYILRRPSPGETLGGGIILDAHPKRRHKRFSEAVLARLEALAQGTPDEVLLQALLALGAAPYEAVEKTANLEANTAKQAVEQLIESGQMVVLGKDAGVPKGKTWVTSSAYWQQIAEKAVGIVSGYHQKFPLRVGIPTEELNSRMGLESRVFNALLEALAEQGEIVIEGALAHRPEHSVTLTPEQQKKVDALLARFASAPFSPPKVKECVEAVGEELYQSLVGLGRLVPVSHEVVFRQEDYQQAVEDLSTLVEKYGTFTLAQARDHWQTTRRYVQDLLEYLDRQGVTVRVGEGRKLR
ncbi:MAG TPA: SelB C-terminal domain-containing protein [Anaerolineales bacterium]|nr:SelB C-terminal domain-containing protein [Anaerolineales bacterium]